MPCIDEFFQVILAEAVEDFGGSGLHILNDILKYIYLGLLVTCFLLALGNRPQGSKWAYTIAVIGFAVITVYMTVRGQTLTDTPIDLYFCHVVCSLFPCLQRDRKHQGRTWRSHHFRNDIPRSNLLHNRAIFGGYPWSLHRGVTSLRKLISWNRVTRHR